MAGLPDALQAAVDAEVDATPPAALAAATAALVEDYAGARPSAVADDAWHAAYLAVRMPATYAAVRAALAHVPAAALAHVSSVLDLGAGPGTASWAAIAVCPTLAAVTQVDRSHALLAIAARLAAAASPDGHVAVTHQVDDVAAARTWTPADLVMSTYAMAELALAARAALVASAWAATRRLLVLVEPGTPAGFAHIHDARTALVAAGAHIVAPCPHEGPCPMRDGTRGGDWCHFSVRLPRTRRHRQLKGGTLGYEDEKFAYLIVARSTDVARAPARVLRHPRVEKGRIDLTLCTPDGATRRVVKKREATWRAARKADWGDVWDEARYAAPESDER